MITRFFQHLLQRLLPLLYTRFAWAYDVAAWLVSRGRWHQWQMAVLESLPGGTLLEIGAGPGHLLSSMLTDGYKVVGLDRSHQMIRRARKRLERLHLPPHLIQASVAAIPLPDRTLGGALSCFPTDYILQEKTLHELHRVLVPTGCVVIIPFALPDPSTIWGRVAGWLLQTPPGESQIPQTWQETFHQAGFSSTMDVVKPSGDVVYRWTLRKRVEEG